MAATQDLQRESGRSRTTQWPWCGGRPSPTPATHQIRQWARGQWSRPYATAHPARKAV